jgi:hypothetical protein
MEGAAGMSRKEPSREATLKEVLAEVSVADIGNMFKGWLKTIGCLALFLAVVFLLDVGLKGAGVSDWGFDIPGWVWGGLIAWAVIHQATSETSFHRLDWSWYFPKQGWLGSLLLAAYAVGFIYLLIWVWNMERGIGSGLAFFAVWLGYTAPFTAFTAVTSLGHKKLMEKRLLEMETFGVSARASS